MTIDLEHSYRYSAQVTRRCARNFYYGIFMLPAEKRRAMCAVYAFMRACDDIADDDGACDRAAQLHARRGDLDAVLRGECSGNPTFPALRDVVQRHRIPGEYLHALIDGAEMDLDVRRYPTFDALYQYCYRVASIVGLVCVHIFGFSGEEALRHAERCGIAFQLTNILRDIREDAERGRIYLPQEDLARFGYSEADLLAGVRNERFLEMMRFQVGRAREYYRSVEALLPLVSPDSRPCLAAMSGIYRGVLERIEATGFDVYSGRVRLSAARKAGITAGAWWHHRGRGETPPSHE